MINQDTIIQNTANYVRTELEGEGSGHDWWHIQRVWKMAKTIAQDEAGDLFVIELAALLHDIADHKFHNGDETVGPRVARAWLVTQQVDEVVINHVCSIIKDLSFKGAEVETPMSTIEGKIVQDADRLDAIGAIGIARAFAYGGHKGREMHNPNKKPLMHASFEEYKNDKGPTINHFYEKLFLLKDRMNTTTAQRIASERHEIMKNFVDQFLDEWNSSQT